MQKGERRHFNSRAAFSYNWPKEERSRSVLSDEWTQGYTFMVYLLTMDYQEITNTLCPIPPCPWLLGGRLITEHQERGSQCNIQPGYQLGSSLPTACRKRPKDGAKDGECLPSLQTSGENPKQMGESRLLFLGSPKKCLRSWLFSTVSLVVGDTEVMSPILGHPVGYSSSYQQSMPILELWVLK